VRGYAWRVCGTYRGFGLAFLPPGTLSARLPATAKNETARIMLALRKQVRLGEALGTELHLIKKGLQQR
jgi:hypothetical protein